MCLFPDGPERVEEGMDQNDTSPSLNERLGDLAFLARALSDENRLRILLLLSDGKKSVSQIVEELHLSQPLISHHLRELKRALLVEVERKGPFVYYWLSRPEVLVLLTRLGSLAESLISSRKSF
jgi:DNA-binding transcriptional ArsR family regulator